MLEVIINGETVFTFERNRLPGHQRQFLDTMDLDMEKGIELNGLSIKEPESKQRARYVAMNLIMAIQGGNTEMASAMCAYLVQRQPELKQIRAIDNGIEVEMELLFREVN